ncbi:MAG: transglycosylase SLT domain-containing protein [Thermoleophilaceae bacterium]
MTPHRPRRDSESGQALVLVLGVVAALITGSLVLAAFGQALGGKSRAQRGADLAAMSAATSMRDDYPRLFEAVVLPNGLPNPRHLSTARYLARARRAAVRIGRRNGVRVQAGDVAFTGGFAPTRVTVRVRGTVAVNVGARAEAPDRQAVAVSASAAAELSPTLGTGPGMPATASGGGYDGPLAYRMAKPMRPDVAQAFDAMARAAARDGLALSVTSAFRSDAEQARLFAANPNPKWVAPPGTSLHRWATELDLGPPGAYVWLKANARRFGFIHRYAWEPWHYGFGANPRDRAHPAQYEKGSWEPPGGDHGRVRHGLPSFVPPRYHDPIARAALRWNVQMNLLAAQLYAESGFNPFAQSPAGAQGIAQFMPGTARSYGLSAPFDAIKAIDAQAHLMSDLLKRFGGKPALALAAYNAGPGAVERYGGVPPYAETRAYVAKILGLLGGVGDLTAEAFEVRLVE